MRKNTLALVIALTLGFPNWGMSAEPTPTPTPQKSGGIRTEFGDVLIENIGIGHTYNLRDLAGIPFKVTNTGADTVNMVCDVLIPDEAIISKERKELGEKPIPSVDWVKLVQSQFVVPAGESAYTDILITIPNDPSLYGKKFHALIYSRTTGLEKMLHLGVYSHLHINIAQSAEIQSEVDKNVKRGNVNQDYTLLPDRLFLDKVPLGKLIDIKKFSKKTIMIANSGENTVDLRVKVVPLGDTPLSLQTDNIEPKNINWLKVKREEIKAEPSSFEDPGLTLELPNDPTLKGKKIMFIVKVSPANPNDVGVTFYGKIYVEVEK